MISPIRRHHRKQPVTTDPAELEYTRAAIVRVGPGRGFIVEGQDNYIITAGHCLPHFPPCNMASYTEERTYANLLGPLGQEPNR